MRIKCQKEELFQNIQNIQGVVSPHTTLPILSYFLLTSKNKEISLFGTDLEVGIKCMVSGEVIKEGGVTLPSRRIFELVREFPKGEIDVFLEDNITTIKCPKTKIKIHTLPVDDFPEFPQIVGKKIIIKGSILKSLLKKTVFAASKEEGRYVLNGVYIFIEDKQIEVVATDGRRLVFKKEIIEEEFVVKKINCILPLRVCNEIIRLITDEDISIILGEKQISFTQKNITITSRLIEGEFPDYSRVIPKNFQEKIIFNKEEFKEAISRAFVLTKEKGGYVKIEIGANRMVVSSRVPEVGESLEEFPVKHDGEQIEIAFNPEYLLDILKNIESKEVFLGLNSPKEAALLRPADDEKFIYVIMPIEMYSG